MAIVYPREVRFFFPTESKRDTIQTIKIRFRSRLPRYLGSDGMALGKTVFIADDPDEASLDLVAHELLHVWDYIGRHTSILADLWDYLKVWFESGLSYTKHTEERFAYTEASRVVKGSSPFVFCKAITDRHLTGYTTMSGDK